MAACGGLQGKILLGAMLLLAAGYVSINFTTSLPRFLVGENLVLAAGYLLFTYLVYSGNCRVLPFLTLFSAFNAGRVSRSIIEPTGEFGELALQHLPLLLLILLVSVLSALLASQQSS